MAAKSSAWRFSSQIDGLPENFWLVVSTYPSEKYESQEWEYDSLINMEKAPNVPNHQAAQHFDWLAFNPQSHCLIGALTCFSIKFPLFLDNRTHSITHFDSQG
jgi:hypothetical protein